MVKDVDTYIRENTHVNYCEAIILKDGRILEVCPSHTYALIKLTGKTKDEINKEMQTFASPLHWLVEYTGSIALWYNMFIYSNMTEEQASTMQKLVNNGIIANNIEGCSTDEYTRCKLMEDLSKGIISELPEKIIETKRFSK